MAHNGVPTRLTFRLGMRRAIRLAHAEGSISDQDAVFLSNCVRHPQKIDKDGKRFNALRVAEHTAITQLRACEGDEAVAVKDIDWSHWLDLLKTWLPVIIRIIIALLPLFLDGPRNGFATDENG